MPLFRMIRKAIEFDASLLLKDAAKSGGLADAESLVEVIDAAVAKYDFVTEGEAGVSNINSQRAALALNLCSLATNHAKGEGAVNHISAALERHNSAIPDVKFIIIPAVAA